MQALTEFHGNLRVAESGGLNFVDKNKMVFWKLQKCFVAMCRDDRWSKQIPSGQTGGSGST